MEGNGRVIRLDQETLRKVQMTELELLEEVDRICRKCGINYCIIAGTLLGAVRHGGFIPWDDDADVALLRREYEKFCEACKEELDTSRFYFQDYKSTPGYRWGYGKLRKKGTIFLRENQEHMPYEQGIFIDIFPLDNTPENYLLRCIHNFECFVYRKFLWSEVGKIADKKWFMRRIYQLMSLVPEKKIKKFFCNFIQSSNRKESSWVRILSFPTPNHVFGYRKAWYEDLEEIKFEGKKFWGIRDYDAYLKFKFGDYMKLPPMNQRKVHPVSKIEV